MFAFSVLGISVAAVFVFYIEVTLRHFQLMVSNRFARTWIYQLGKVMNGAYSRLQFKVNWVSNKTVRV